MKTNHMKIAILGLGEAGSHFANDLVEKGVEVYGFDPKPTRLLHPKIKLMSSNKEAVQEADIIFSVNLSSESESIAHEIESVLNDSQFFCEMNTSGPEKKQKIEQILLKSRVKMIDLAIMAPVPPKGVMTPLLASSKYASDFIKFIEPLHLDIHFLENSKIGDAATRKLLRSIVYKGIAAVVCEAMEAGEKFGMESYIRGQIQSLIGGNDELIDRFVEGSRTHALRRMHEMEAVMEMLSTQSIEPIISTATRNNLEKLFHEKTNQK